jgi:hypothetical protein
VNASVGKIAQTNPAEALKLPSLTVTVTFEVAAVVGVPVMSPVLELMLKPTGSPLAP